MKEYRQTKSDGSSYQTLYDKLSVKLPLLKECPLTSVISSLQSLDAKQKNLKKTKSKLPELNDFNQNCFVIPKKRPKLQNCTNVTNACDDTEIRRRCSVLEESNIKLSQEIHQVNNRSQELIKENRQLDEENKSLKKKLVVCRRRPHVKVLNQKLKRKQLQLNKYKQECFVLKKALDKFVKEKCCKCDTLLNKLKKVRKQLANFQYHKKKKNVTKTSRSSQMYDEYFEDSNASLRDELSESKSQFISSKSDGRTYSDNLREVIYMCISKNVSLENMQDVISFILQKLADKYLLSFPSVSTLRQMEREMGPAARLGVSEELAKSDHTTGYLLSLTERLFVYRYQYLFL